jgi:hypothetical protein
MIVIIVFFACRYSRFLRRDERLNLPPHLQKKTKRHRALANGSLPYRV